MNRVRWQGHVLIDPEIHHGDPCIRGTRIPVRTIVASLADGATTGELLRSYPQITTENVLGALAYAADLMREETRLCSRSLPGPLRVKVKVDEDLQQEVAED